MTFSRRLLLAGFAVGAPAAAAQPVRDQTDKADSALLDVRDAGSLSPDSDNTSTFDGALAGAAASGKAGIFIPPGRWPGSIIVKQDNVRIVGAGRPVWTGSALAGGTIIVGGIENRRVGTEIGHLGVDQSTVSSTIIDGLHSGGASDEIAVGYYYHDLAFLGRGYSGGKSAHALLMQNGTNSIVERILAIRYAHGVAVRMSRAHVRDIETIDMEASSVIFKSDSMSGKNDCIGSSLDGLSAKTTAPRRNANIIIESRGTGKSTRNIRVQNVLSEGSASATITVDKDPGGEVDNVLVSNVTSDGCSADRAFAIIHGTNITLSTCIAKDNAGFSFRNSAATGVKLFGCVSINAKAAAYFQDAPFDFAQINNEIIGAKISGAQVGRGKLTTKLQDGLLEYDGTSLYFTTGGVRRIVNFS
ncbi:hypothetical protein NLM33_17665 [Bradyrhizobium sp. CCGUVB1N3]|uniref:hypothetical protein n=1 Tax=Bradyrhizobium sp. CCGUVB1N3 TaxID=2949629 RepID=UPI0020B2E833|nr:hypothetical protein [Bradyrhizobium sp. CCGUVB1N3]MCP3472144.1 hypothetical protein [Bradyrhizobium sp. CCGUVB1N3]